MFAAEAAPVSGAEAAAGDRPGRSASKVSTSVDAMMTEVCLVLGPDDAESDVDEAAGRDSPASSVLLRDAS